MLFQLKKKLMFLFKELLNITESNKFLNKSYFEVKKPSCLWRSEMEGDNCTKRLLSKTFVKQNLSETDISVISFCFHLNSFLWSKTLS